MIDYLMKFATEAAAQADPVVGAFCIGGVWRDDVCVPNARVWDTTLDVAGTDSDGNPTVTHQYQPFWYVTITGANAALLAHAACALAIDWSIPTVLKSDIPADQVRNYEVSPVIAGRDIAALIAGLPQ